MRFGAALITVSDICRLQTADCRLQTADYRSQTAYSRPQTVDHKTLTGDLEDHRA